ncbi:MAG: transposase, partial [Bacteroidota bacterium]
MFDYRRNSHSTSNISCHIVWSTKYRYKILKGDLQERCRDLLVQ